MRRVFDGVGTAGPAAEDREPPDDDRRPDDEQPVRLFAGAQADRRRAQVHVLGFVLLLGIVATGSIAIVLLGTAGLDAYETAAEVESAEGALVEFAHAAETATIAGDPVPVSVGAFDRGTVETRGDAGQIRVLHETDSGTEELHSEPLGTLRYVDGDTEIAYQGGGVWRSDGNGSVPVSSPALEYREGTLTFSIAQLADTETRGNSFSGSVRQSDSATTLDLREDDPTVPRGGTGDVRIQIESAHCDGWEQEIDATIPGSLTERCSEGNTDRVEFELTVPPTVDTVDSAVVAHEIDVHPNAPQIDGDVRTASIDEDRVNGTVIDGGYDYPSIDETVSELVADCETEGVEELPEEVTEPGRYCVDSIDDDHTFDTSAGDIQVVVRDSIGDPNYQGRLDVEGEHNLTIVVDGDLDVRGNAVIGNETDPSRTRLLFSADSTVTTANGSPTIAALLYAPDSTVSAQGNPTIDGSIVADRVEIGNVQPGGVGYDDRISGVEISPSPGPPLYYLDVTASELTIDD